MKEKMPAAIKKKALKQSAMLSKTGGLMTKFSNYKNDNDVKNIENNEFYKNGLSTEERRSSLKKVINFSDLVILLLNNPVLKKKVRKEKKNSFLS